MGTSQVNVSDPKIIFTDEGEVVEGEPIMRIDFIFEDSVQAMMFLPQATLPALRRAIESWEELRQSEDQPDPQEPLSHTE